MPGVSASFAPGERYELLRPLGRGGMGEVYAAFDHELGIEVALKRLTRLDPDNLLRFKQEFRLVRDLDHPNLVRLFELGEFDGTWYLTMELLDGVGLLRYVHKEPADDTLGTASTAGYVLPGKGAPASEPSILPPIDPPYDEARVRDALGQLARGLDALHRAGVVHRDVKPSNAIVTRDGRAVLLDFGLATDLDDRSTDGLVIGTAAYMAPEQAASESVGPAADWYAFGALLYEALTGSLPFRCAAVDVLMQKQLREPPPPLQRVPAVVPELNQLCVDLMRIEPSARPTAEHVVSRLDGSQRPAPRSRRPSAALESEFVGRAAELAVLRDAAAAVRCESPVQVFVHGPSGMGKTALVARHLQAAESAGAMVLRGRCYENETVPFKAFDGAMDELSSTLRRLPEVERHTVLPRRAALLPRLFPVLGRVDAIARAPWSDATPADPQEQRWLAFAALRELLTRLADRRPVVLALDDLQWTDRDSLELLKALVAPGASRPGLLVVATSRTSEPPDLGASIAWRTVEVGPLSDDAARELATRLLGENPGDAAAGAIASEAGGHPLFVAELARFARPRASADDATVALDEAIWARVRHLEEAPRRVLELAALAVTPLSARALASAASIEGRALVRALSTLRAARLISSEAGSDARIIAYHDRVREAVTAHMSDGQQRDDHARLANAFDNMPGASPEAIAHHALAAGDVATAVARYEQAAEEAAGTFATDRAAELYRRVLALSSPDPARASQLHTAIGDALSLAGRGREAAEAYLGAVVGAAPADAMRLRNLAAIHLMHAGYVVEGLAGIDESLAQVGVALPRTRAGAIGRFLIERTRIGMRGYRFEPRSEESIPARDLLRVDALAGAAEGLGWVDGIRMLPLQATLLRSALAAGEPERIVRSLAYEANYISLRGVGNHAKACRVIERARSIADELHDPRLDATFELVAPMFAFNELRFGDGASSAAAAKRALAAQADVGAWDRMTASVYNLWGLAFTGQLRAFRASAAELLATARHSDNRLLGSVVGFFDAQYGAALQDGNAKAANAVLDDAIAPWRDREFGFLHFLWLRARIWVALCASDGGAALDLIAGHRRDLARSGSMHVQILRVLLRADTASAHVLRYDQMRAAADLRAARRLARQLDREGPAFATGTAARIRAAVAMRCGDSKGAERHLIDAAAAFDDCGTAAHAHACRWQRASPAGDDANATLRDEAQAYFDAEQIHSLPRLMRAVGFGAQDDRALTA